MTKMQAVRSGNGFRLSGDKAFVVDGHTADLLIVAARTAGTAGERDGLTLFLVDPKAKGIETERTVMVDSHNAARIKFDNAEVNADGVLGEVDQGLASCCKACSTSAEVRWPPKWSGSARKCSAAPLAISRSASSSAG